MKALLGKVTADGWKYGMVEVYNLIILDTGVAGQNGNSYAVISEKQHHIEGVVGLEGV